MGPDKKLDSSRTRKKCDIIEEDEEEGSEFMAHMPIRDQFGPIRDEYARPRRF